MSLVFHILFYLIFSLFNNTLDWLLLMISLASYKNTTICTNIYVGKLFHCQAFILYFWEELSLWLCPQVIKYKLPYFIYKPLLMIMSCIHLNMFTMLSVGYEFCIYWWNTSYWWNSRFRKIGAHGQWWNLHISAVHFRKWFRYSNTSKRVYFSLN